MAPVPIFKGRVTDDGERLVLLDGQRQWRRQHLRTLAGKDVEVIVRKVRSQRSLDQNSYIHTVPVPILAEEFGNTIEEMKLVLMGECFGWHRDKVTGREVPIKPHTSEMSIEEASQFIEWVIPWAAVNHGVEIPYPNEVDYSSRRSA